jgi:hypothetical protein
MEGCSACSAKWVLGYGPLLHFMTNLMRSVHKSVQKFEGGCLLLLLLKLLLLLLLLL